MLKLNRRKAPPSLFWRTFILLCGLIVFSVMIWLQSFRIYSEIPYAQGIAQQIVTTVNLTRYALVSADPMHRKDLLRLLARREGLQISPHEPTDRIDAFGNEGMHGLIAQRVLDELGEKTILANRVNGKPGLWVTINIDGESFWLKTRADLLNPTFGSAWIYWATLAGLFSLVGATLLTRHIIRPLRALSAFATQVGQGKRPPPLPEDEGTVEIQMVNRNFNHMVEDLRRIEADRELLLAGVSHDLRTPITRLRLEIELASLPEDSREAMVSDLLQMENIVDQFLSYSRQSYESQSLVDLSEATQQALNNARMKSGPTLELETHFAEPLCVVAHPLELSRAIQNLFTNAQRYGVSDDGILRLSVTVKPDKKGARLEVRDQGRGLPDDEFDRVIRPFERGESARTGVTGTGLGLAIVDRFMRRAGGALELSKNDPHGLCVAITLPLATESCKKRLKLEAEKRKAQDKLQRG